MSEFVRRSADLTLNDVPVVGGKNASLPRSHRSLVTSIHLYLQLIVG